VLWPESTCRTSRLQATTFRLQLSQVLEHSQPAANPVSWLLFRLSALPPEPFLTCSRQKPRKARPDHTRPKTSGCTAWPEVVLPMGPKVRPEMTRGRHPSRVQPFGQGQPGIIQMYNLQFTVDRENCLCFSNFISQDDDWFPYDYAGFNLQPLTEKVVGIVRHLCRHARLNVPHEHWAEYNSIARNVIEAFYHSARST